MEGKMPKQRLTAAFFAAADSSKISEPAVVWKSKSTRFLKNIQDKIRPSMVHYFSDEKAFMRTEITEDVLSLLDRKVQLQRRKIILFLDNSPPLDAGIIRGIKRLVKYVASRIDEGKNASEIKQDVNIAKAIHWLQVAWRDISPETIINCFQKCGFGQESVNSITNDNEIDEECEILFTQFSEDDEITVEDFVTFDDNLTASTWSNKYRLYKLATTSLRGSY